MVIVHLSELKSLDPFFFFFFFFFFNGLLHQKKGNGNSKEQREMSLGIDRLIETVGTRCDYLLK